MLRKDDKGRRTSRKFMNLRHKQNKAERIAEERRVAAISANRKIRHEANTTLRNIIFLSPERLEEVMI